MSFPPSQLQTQTWTWICHRNRAWEVPEVTGLYTVHLKIKISGYRIHTHDVFLKDPGAHRALNQGSFRVTPKTRRKVSLPPERWRVCDQSLTHMVEAKMSASSSIFSTLVLVSFWDSLSLNLDRLGSELGEPILLQHCDYRMVLGPAFLRGRRLWRSELWTSHLHRKHFLTEPSPRSQYVHFFLMGFGFVIVLAFKKDLLLFLITSIPVGGGMWGCWPS